MVSLLRDHGRAEIKEKIRSVIFEANTFAGKAFDVFLIVVILLSVLAVSLDSVTSINQKYGHILIVIEWGFTVLFTVEYLLRLWTIQNTWLYARSFYGVIDLLGSLPTYLSIWFADAHYFLVVRVLRVLRIFRVFRMVRYVGEAELISQALVASRRKITVFVCSVLALVVVFGSLMYLVEGGTNTEFSSIPQSIYWAVTTMTTVGYGDVAPDTGLGRGLAAVIMIMGYGIIAVPTGIVTLELNEAHRKRANTKTCPTCSAEGHSYEASFCWRCGSALFQRSSGQAD